MNEYTNSQIHKLKRRIAELDSRIKSRSQWTDGELTIFKIQLKSCKSKIKELLEEGSFKE